MSSETTDKSAWNLSQMWLQGLNLSIIRAHEAFRLKNPRGALDNFRITSMKFISNLNPEERIKLKLKGKEVAQKVLQWEEAAAKSKSGFITAHQKFLLTTVPLNIALDSIEEYNDMLLDLLEKYDLLLKKQRDRTRIN